MTTVSPLDVEPQASEAQQRPRHASGDIHPTAIIDPAARLGRNVAVGAYAVIGAGVSLGDDCEVMHHANLQGPLTAGRGNRFYPFCSVGMEPQDKKHEEGGRSELVLGDDNIIREFVTINRGSSDSAGVTRVGSHNWIMAYCHIAHDCHVGDHTVFANGATLGGHVTVADRVTLGGFTAVHQFCSIGTLTMTGGQTMIAQDVPPYVIATGNRVRLYGINKIGMERNGFTRAEIAAVNKAYKLFFRSRLKAEEALARIEAELGGSLHVRRFAAFIRASKRGICR